MLHDGNLHSVSNVVTSTFTSPTFADLFREYAEQTDDVAQIASAICTRLRLDAVQRATLWSIILDHCRTIDRNNVRRIEKTVKPARVGQPVDPTAARSDFMDKTFTPGDGRRVLWGEATIKDHEMRIDFLAKHRDGIDTTIQRHREAIELLKASGASCLNELLEATK